MKWHRPIYRQFGYIMNIHQVLWMCSVVVFFILTYNCERLNACLAYLWNRRLIWKPFGRLQWVCFCRFPSHVVCHFLLFRRRLKKFSLNAERDRCTCCTHPCVFINFIPWVFCYLGRNLLFHQKVVIKGLNQAACSFRPKVICQLTLICSKFVTHGWYSLLYNMVRTL